MNPEDVMEREVSGLVAAIADYDWRTLAGYGFVLLIVIALCAVIAAGHRRNVEKYERRRRDDAARRNERSATE